MVGALLGAKDGAIEGLYDGASDGEYDGATSRIIDVFIYLIIKIICISVVLCYLEHIHT